MAQQIINNGEDGVDIRNKINENTTELYNDKLTSTQLTDLTDAGDSALHYHATDRDRSNHTGTQTASTISDFDTQVNNNSKFDTLVDSVYNAIAESIPNDGTTDIFATLTTLLATISTNNATIYLGRGTYKLSTNITIPSNVNLKIENGAIFSVDSGVTLTVNGGIDAGIWQIFSGLGSVVGSPKIDECYPEWFGAVADGFLNDGLSPTDAGTMTDNTVPFNKAFAFFNTLKISTGKYRILKVSAPINSTIRGISKEKSFLGIYVPGSVDFDWVMNFSSDNINVSDLTFDMFDMQGNIQGDLNGGLVCSYIRTASNVKLKNVRCQNNGTGCIYLGESSYIYFDDCDFKTVDTCVNSDTGNNLDSFIYFDNCNFNGSIASEPIYLRNAKNIFITNCDSRNKLEGNGFEFDGCENVNIDKCVFENLGAGVYVNYDSVSGKFSKNVTIKNSKFINSRFREIFLNANTQDVLIYNNIFEKEEKLEPAYGEPCIFIVSSSNIIIQKNKFYNENPNTIYFNGSSYNAGDVLISDNKFYPQAVDKTQILFFDTALNGKVTLERNYFYDFLTDTNNLIVINQTSGIEKVIFRDDNWIEGAQAISNIPISISTTLRSPLYFTSYAVGDVYRPIASTTIFVKVCTVAGYLDKGTTWGATTAYTTEDTLLIGSNLYYPIADGTSGGTPPVESGTSDIIDGTVTWTHLGTPGTFGGTVAIT